MIVADLNSSLRLFLLLAASRKPVSPSLGSLSRSPANIPTSQGRSGLQVTEGGGGRMNTLSRSKAP